MADPPSIKNTREDEISVFSRTLSTFGLRWASQQVLELVPPVTRRTATNNPATMPAVNNIPATITIPSPIGVAPNAASRSNNSMTHHGSFPHNAQPSQPPQHCITDLSGKRVLTPMASTNSVTVAMAPTSMFPTQMSPTAKIDTSSTRPSRSHHWVTQHSNPRSKL
jgi:hypothetical protein